MEIAEKFLPYLGSDGKIERLPSKYSRRVELATFFLPLFQFDVKYSEAEVNELLGSHVVDFAFVRRTLVDLGYLQRDRYGIEYSRIK